MDPHQSSRKASMGTSWAARRAGRLPANSAIPHDNISAHKTHPQGNTKTPPNHWAHPHPKSSPRAIPSPAPKSPIIPASHKNCVCTCPEVAPKAMQTPTSRVRSRRDINNVFIRPTPAPKSAKMAITRETLAIKFNDSSNSPNKASLRCKSKSSTTSGRNPLMERN